MKLRPLIIDEDAKTDIARVIAYAAEHPLDTKTMHRAIVHPEMAIGNNQKHGCIVKIGYRCVYSIEDQPMGKCRHLSVSVLGSGTAPNEAAVEMLMKEFGFTCSLTNCDSMWIEEIEDGKIAINIMQKLPLDSRRN